MKTKQINGRGERIRTSGLLVPNQALYQAEPRPESLSVATRGIMRAMMMGVTLRDLPSVNDVVERLGPAVARFPHALVVAEVRKALDTAREVVKAGAIPQESIQDSIDAAVKSALAA